LLAFDHEHVRYIILQRLQLNFQNRGFFGFLGNNLVLLLPECLYEESLLLQGLLTLTGHQNTVLAGGLWVINCLLWFTASFLMVFRDF